MLAFPALNRTTFFKASCAGGVVLGLRGCFRSSLLRATCRPLCHFGITVPTLLTLALGFRLDTGLGHPVQRAIKIVLRALPI